MHVTITGRHMEVTPALKDHVHERLDKIREHFDRVIDVNVILDVEKHRHIAEFTLHANGVHIHSKETTGDMYGSVDKATEKLHKQVLKFKDRIRKHQNRRGKGGPEYNHHIIEMGEAGDYESAADAEAAAGGDTIAVRTPRHSVVYRETIDMKPMSVEEAALQLELADDRFLVFSNAGTQKVNVLYSREDGTFGLIEPQF